MPRSSDGELDMLFVEAKANDEGREFALINVNKLCGVKPWLLPAPDADCIVVLKIGGRVLIMPSFVKL